MMSTLTVLIVGLVSGLNPYTIGVLILLCAVIYGHGQSTKRTLGMGLAYTVTLIGLSLLGGIMMVYLFSLLPLVAGHYMALGIGVLIVCAGLLEIKDFFWYGRGISTNLPGLAARHINSLTKQRPGILSAVALGVLVAVATVPAGSAPYFGVMTLLRGHFGAGAIGLLGLYNALLALPMLAILAAVATGTKTSTLLRWREQAKGTVRLAIGSMLILLGWAVILTEIGVINLT